MLCFALAYRRLIADCGWQAFAAFDVGLPQLVRPQGKAGFLVPQQCLSFSETRPFIAVLQQQPPAAGSGLATGLMSNPVFAAPPVVAVPQPDRVMVMVTVRSLDLLH